MLVSDIKLQKHIVYIYFTLRICIKIKSSHFLSKMSHGGRRPGGGRVYEKCPFEWPFTVKSPLIWKNINFLSPGRCQFHQHLTCSFYARRSHKSVKRYLWLNCLFLRFWDLRAKKLYIELERWWNWALPSISSTFYVRIFRANVVLAPYNVTGENNVRTKNARV